MPSHVWCHRLQLLPTARLSFSSRSYQRLSARLLDRPFEVARHAKRQARHWLQLLMMMHKLWLLLGMLPSTTHCLHPTHNNTDHETRYLWGRGSLTIWSLLPLHGYTYKGKQGDRVIAASLRPTEMQLWFLCLSICSFTTLLIFQCTSLHLPALNLHPLIPIQP